MKQFFTSILFLIFALANAQNTQIQFLNNSADSTLLYTKITINDSTIKDSLQFRKATSFITLAGDSTHKIKFISKQNIAIFDSLMATLQANKKYVCILNGVSNPLNYANNPNEANTALKIMLIDVTQTANTITNPVQLYIANGTTDLPTFDITLTDSAKTILASNDSLHNYKNIILTASNISLHFITTNGNVIISTFAYPISDKQNQSLVIFTSGFVAPGLNKNSANLGVFMLDSNGVVTQLANVSKIKNNLELNNFSLYPNPTTNFITADFSLKNNAETLTFKIVDLNGRIVFEEIENIYTKQNSKTIQLQNIETGLYFLNISDGENIVSKRFYKR